MIGGWLNRRFFNGRPATTLLQLVVASIVVGAVLAWLDFTPLDVWETIVRFLGDVIEWISDRAGRVVALVIKYLALGAAIVVPVWFVLRIFVSPDRRTRAADPDAE